MFFGMGLILTSGSPNLFGGIMMDILRTKAADKKI
jgi:hypothetical protein